MLVRACWRAGLLDVAYTGIEMLDHEMQFAADGFHRNLVVYHYQPAQRHHHYQAETPKECAEIVGKIKFLVERSARKKSGMVGLGGVNF